MLRPSHVSVALCCALSAAVTAQSVSPSGHHRAAPSRYLYVWTGMMDSLPADSAHEDFLAVVDLTPGASGRYGTITWAARSGTRNTMAHHVEPAFPGHGHFFASGFHSGQLFLYDVSDRARPRLTTTVAGVPGYWRPHSMVRLANGHVLATVQFRADSTSDRPGALAELDDDGQVVRVSSAADSSMPGAHIRPYALAIFPAIDRVVTTSSPMNDEVTADVVQLWRLSDLRLLATIRTPAANGDEHHPFEVQPIGDGRTAMINTYACGFYTLTGMQSRSPVITHVFSLNDGSKSDQGCSVPSVRGRWWIMPIAYQHRVVVLDVGKPSAPRIASSLATDTTFTVHWSSLDPASDRVVLSGQGNGDPLLLIARLNDRTGALTLDTLFRAPGATSPGMRFDRMPFPNGLMGPAMPHGAVFVPR